MKFEAACVASNEGLCELRPYQRQGVKGIQSAFNAGKRAPLFALPTGAGKTFCFAYLTREAAKLGRRVVILVHRQELLKQASRSLTTLGVNHGIIAPGHHGETAQVAVASIQTLDRRLRRGPVHFDLAIIDEAHHVVSLSWRRVLDQLGGAQILGVTATPCRLDGRGLGVEAGGLFDHLVQGPSIAELISLGHLVRPVVYAYPNDIDMTGVKIIGGDYSRRELSERMDKPAITGCAVDHYRRLAANEPAIAFCASLVHAAHVADEFAQGGFRSGVIHGGLTETERQERLDGLASGRIHVLASVDLISEGTDVPAVSVAILLRRTASESLFLQQVGRILRPSPGKTRGLVLDHVGNVLQFGLPEQDRQWSLGGVKKRVGLGGPGLTMRQCKKCFAVWRQGQRCPSCGNVAAGAVSREPLRREGELRQVDETQINQFRQNKKRAYAMATSYSEVLALTMKFGDKPGFAYKYWSARKRKRGAR